MSPAQEQRIGDQQHGEIMQKFGGAYDNPVVARYVDQIGQRLARLGELPQLDYTFTVLDSDIVNAFALPGGYVYITRGLLSIGYDEAEIAGVIAHEIGHITARHSASRYSRAVLAQLGGLALGIATDNQLAGALYGIGAGAIIQSYSRSQEFEADSLGVRYLSRAGYDPLAMADFLTALEAHTALQASLSGNPGAAQQFSIFASHPRTAKRVLEAAEAAGFDAGELAGGRAGGVRNRDAYLDAIDGMSYGGSRAQGFVRGRSFIHPELRFRFTAPRGFELNNGAAQVIGLGPDQAVMAFDMAPRGNARNMVDYLQRLWAGNTRLRDVRQVTVDGLQGATGLARLGEEEVRLVVLEAGIGNQVYRFQFRAPPGVMRQREADFRASAYSFRRLSAEEARRAEPLRIVIRTVAPGETVASLAEELPFESLREPRFRVLNGLNNGEEISAGMRVKTIR